MKIMTKICALLLVFLATPALALDYASIPTKFAISWGASAVSPYINTIPQASQIGITNCRASLTDGFPPLTFIPSGAGGCPPFGADFNGILKQITQWSQWQNAGGVVKWDSSFSTSIGGYPKGATVANASTVGCTWTSSTDNNVTNPDAAGAGWISSCLNTIATGVTVVTGGVTDSVLTVASGGFLAQLATSGTGFIVKTISPTINTAALVGATISGTMAGDFTLSGSLTMSGGTFTGFRLLPVLFGSLPSCSGREGALAPVTDSATATWGATITGSSTNHVLAYCDGTNWTVAGK